MSAERPDHRLGGKRRQRFIESWDALIDDLLGLSRGVRAFGPVLVGDRLQIRQAVEGDARHISDGCVDIARHGQVKHHQRVRIGCRILQRCMHHLGANQGFASGRR